MSEKNATRIVKRWWYNWICRTNFCSTKCQTSTCLTKCYSSDKTRVHKLFEYCNTCPTKGKSVTRLGREMITSSTFITNTVINKSSAGIYEVKCICTDKQNSRYVSWHCIPREATSNPPRRIPLKENNLSTPQKKKPPERRHPRKKNPPVDNIDERSVYRLAVHRCLRSSRPPDLVGCNIPLSSLALSNQTRHPQNLQYLRLELVISSNPSATRCFPLWPTPWNPTFSKAPSLPLTKGPKSWPGASTLCVV